MLTRQDMFFDFLKTFQNASQIENNLECELRIKLHRSQRFMIHEEMADHLRNLFVLNEFPCTIENTIVEKFRNSNVRKITTIDSGAVRYERKQRKEQFQNFRLPIDITFEGLDIRIALSSEIDMPKSEGDTIKEEIDGTQTRKRLRHMFSVEKNGISLASYMLTKVEMPPGTVPFYEFEIEFNIYQGDVRRHIVETYHKMVGLLTQLRARFTLNESLSKFYSTTLSIRDAKPKNMKRRNVIDILNVNNGYTVTNKLDGERMVVLCIPVGPLRGIYAFNRRRTLRFSASAMGLPTVVLDTEWFDDRFYVFDCMYDGQNITELPHSSRLEHAKRLVTILSTLTTKCLSITMKEFLPARKAVDMLQNMSPYERDIVNDGLIFTKNDKYQSDEIFKWKFPSKMTIDFAVRWNGNGYDLYVYTTGEKLVRLKIGDGPVYASYNGSRNLKNDHIYEFGYDSNTKQFVLFRERADKKLPNFWKVAQDVWEDIINPITEDELKRLLNPIRMISNQMKRELIQDNCGNKVVLDLGIGRGGDLGKYEKVKVERLFGIEPNENNLSECRKRLSENEYMIDRTHLLLAKAQDSEKIRTFLESNQQKEVDVISSFLSLSFFFFTENDLDALVDTISSTLKNGGLFIGTTIDGEKTRELLDKSPNGTFEYDQGYIKWGENKETVVITMKDTIVGENQVESLVDFAKLEKRLNERDIFLVKKEMFKWNKDELTETENTFNSLYDSFIFQKDVKVIPPSPPSLPSVDDSEDKKESSYESEVEEEEDEEKEEEEEGEEEEEEEEENIYKPRGKFIEEVLRRMSLPKYKHCSLLFQPRIKSMNPFVIQFGKKEYTFDANVVTMNFHAFKNIWNEWNESNIPNVPKIYGNIPSRSDSNETIFITESVRDVLFSLPEFMEGRHDMIVLSLILQLYHTLNMVYRSNVTDFFDLSVSVKQDQNITSIEYEETVVNVFDGYIVMINIIKMSDSRKVNTVKTILSDKWINMTVLEKVKPLIDLVTTMSVDDINRIFQEEEIPNRFAYPVRVRRGIENAGNTCYLNSVIQCIVTPPPIINYFCNPYHQKYQKDLIQGNTSFTRAFAKLVCQLTKYKKGNAITRRQISDKSHGIQSLLCEIYPQYCEKENGIPTEHDASEFYGSLIDILQSQLSLHVNRNFIDQLFKIQVMTRDTCDECGGFSNKDSFSYDLKLAIPEDKKEVELEECIKSYGEKTKIEKICRSTCMYQNKRNEAKSKQHTREEIITHLPELLTISLSRFRYDKKSFRVKKLKTQIHFPSTLIINEQRRTLQYKLYATVIHQGESADSGHYYAHVKTNENEWTKFNDSQVRTISEEEVLNSKSNVYMLFYHLTDVLCDEINTGFSCFKAIPLRKNKDKDDKDDKDKDTKISKKMHDKYYKNKGAMYNYVLSSYTDE